jgi:hypothetical protein
LDFTHENVLEDQGTMAGGVLGMTTLDDGGRDNREAKKKHTHAMTLIQKGVHDSLFSRIAGADTTKDTWDILRLEFQGDTQV